MGSVSIEIQVIAIFNTAERVMERDGGGQEREREREREMERERERGGRKQGYQIWPQTG